jgi:hypothetical protein
MKIPTYDESMKRCGTLKETPVERFIYENEPAGEDASKEFREQLQELVDFLLMM